MRRTDPHLRGRPTRRSAALAAAAAAALVLSACSSGSAGGGSSAGSGSGASSGAKLKMGIAVANISLNFAHEMVLGAQSAADHAGGVDWTAVGPPNTDGPAEQQLFTSLTSTAHDGVVLENLDPPIFTRPAAQAVAKGVPIVALDTSPTPGSGVTFYVGNDNYQLGVELAQETLKRLGTAPHGTVVIGEPNPGTPVLDSRAKGIKDTLNAKAPGITVLGPFQTYSDPAQNYSAWLSQVHAQPHALAFLGVGDADSYDLARIKQQEKGSYLVAGMDVDAKTLEDVKAGLDFVTIDPEHFLKGYIATTLLIDAVKQHKSLPQGWFETPGLVVDQSNVDAIIQRETSAQAAYSWYKSQIDSLLGDVAANLKPLSDAR
ncbi:sugar ABC transporter substrate-binding protein [Streptacidiphilus sp. N1-10]|uniref:Sugar ABC transporter substrate-binding protein n=1 Tax=Streptacidiphilus jeojiensis TaxID=3229225 RepID=A0ABV6XGH7_9ACTN